MSVHDEKSQAKAAKKGYADFQSDGRTQGSSLSGIYRSAAEQLSMAAAVHEAKWSE